MFISQVAEWAPCVPLVLPSMLEHVSRDQRDQWARDVLVHSAPYFAYTSLPVKVTLHAKHYIIRALCI